MKLLLASFITIFTITSFAEVQPDTSLSSELEQLKYICADEEGGFALSTQLKKVWQIDSIEDTYGLKLTILDFEKLQCPHCVDIKAEFSLFGETVNYTLNLKAKESSFTEANLTATLSANDHDPKYLSYNCKIINP